MKRYIYLDSLPKDILHVIEVLIDASNQTCATPYLVGGIIRDILLGREDTVSDVDVMVAGDAFKFATCVTEILCGKMTGPSPFMTYRIDYVQKGRMTSLDIAVPRVETYPKLGKLPKVRMASVKEDLIRRDFSINAMATSLRESPHTLMDFFNGYEDLQLKKVRVLHAMSFHDDPTRIFRAARFCARYDFELDFSTLASIPNALPVLLKVSDRRIKRELDLIHCEATCSKAIELLRTWGVTEKYFCLEK